MQSGKAEKFQTETRWLFFPSPRRKLCRKAIGLLEQEGIRPAHYDMRFVKPLDETLLHEVFKEFKKVVTVEDGCIMGGMGSAILEFMADHNYQAQVVRLGIPEQSSRTRRAG
ncbi:transketolase C-terminal domain-containing protein [Anseongella ginsenosidimutans]|uniref:transketolase C-terminal domain-containing protein n=1 Tax=Anseongella ginsenosidimutans TaxID=496056 RepID=UPI001CEF8F09|nr:transketolase C-terminal domain-containing protein [Anseongella ginsenosidimutans]